MARYLVQPRDRIFVKGYVFLSFAKNMSKNIGKSLSKNLSCKYRQKFLDHAKESAIDALKTVSKTAIQKRTEAAGYLIGNRIADRFTKASETSQQSNSESYK